MNSVPGDRSPFCAKFVADCCLCCTDSAPPGLPILTGAFSGLLSDVRLRGKDGVVTNLVSPSTLSVWLLHGTLKGLFTA